MNQTKLDTILNINNMTNEHSNQRNTRVCETKKIRTKKRKKPCVNNSQYSLEVLFV